MQKPRADGKSLKHRICWMWAVLVESERGAAYYAVNTVHIGTQAAGEGITSVPPESHTPWFLPPNHPLTRHFALYRCARFSDGENIAVSAMLLYRYS